MKQELSFKGLTLNRSEQSVQPGELALCGNVELHDGALRPSVLNGTIKGRLIVTHSNDTAVTEGTTVIAELLYVHQTSNYTNYIAKYTANNTVKYCWYNSSCVYQSTLNALGFSNLVDIKSIGNTLVVLKTTDTHYFKFNNNSTYKYLGERPPFPRLQFSLESDGTPSSEDVVIPTSWIQDRTGNDGWDVIEEHQSSVTESIMAEINKQIVEVTEDGCFYAPFLIRYCYHMYENDALAWHSAPVLMIPTLQHPVTVKFTNPSVAASATVVIEKAVLKWKCLNQNLMQLLSDWTDIIKSVDIYISTQFSRIDTSKLITSILKTADHPDLVFNENILGGVYRTSNTSGEVAMVELPERDINKYYKNIADTSEFFKLVSLEATPAQFATSDFVELDVSPEKLKTIATQDQMVDDYHSHYDLTGAGGYVYNQRLNIYNVSQKIREPQPLSLRFPYCTTDADVSSRAKTITTARLVANTESGQRVVQIEDETTQKIPWNYFINAYLFFSDSRYSHLEFQIGSDYYKLNLREHALLEGAVSFDPDHTHDPLEITSMATVSNAAISFPNKIYQSDVNNPFYFPLEGIKTIGIGEIKGIAAATRALSPGQFGQFPLMAFCTDGIWAMEVTKEGTYLPPKNISREVCVNPQSICQLDQSVLFATKRAFSRIVEQNVISMSDMLDGPMIDCGTLLPGYTAGTTPYATFRSLFNNNAPFDDETVYDLMGFETHPLDFFTAGQTLYDFANERVIILPASPATINPNFVFVLSLRDGSWSTMLMPSVIKAINSYPHPYLQIGNVGDYAAGSIVCLDKPYDYDDDDDTVTSGILVTRTINYQTMMKVIQGFEQMHTCDFAYQAKDSAGHLLFYCLVGGTTVEGYTTDNGSTWKKASDNTSITLDAGSTPVPVMLSKAPVIFLYGSNDNLSWKYIGYSARIHSSYLPGHPFRFFRLALYLRMKQNEKYYSIILDIIEKYNKL